MKTKKIIKWGLITCAISVGVFFGLIILFPATTLQMQGSNIKPILPTGDIAPLSILDNPIVEVIKEVIVPKQTSVALPVKLTIAKINTAADVKYVGLTPQGAMGAPKEATSVVWFKLGPRPGEIGSAVIAGHYGWKDNLAAVFDNLHTLVKGDKVSVEDEKGQVITFVVREIRSYDQNADARDVFESSDGKAHLNLVTCQGVWNKGKQSYSKRLVVFTDREYEK